MCANFQGKQTAFTFSAQICLKMDLGLEIQKTNVGKRISILEILCMPIFRQNEQFCDFFDPNLPKNGFRVGNWENSCRNKNQHLGDTMCANFQAK